MGQEPQAFLEGVRATVLCHNMIADTDRVLVAVSGGPDSVCLLHVLRALGATVEVAHFDHQTRDGESAADARFVRELAGREGAPFHTESRPVEQEARARSASFEEHARRVRYTFLHDVARRHQCTVIATGHTADDQAETVVMRLLRGTGPTGMAGIRPVHRRQGVRIIRPLLTSTKEDVIAYLTRHGFPYREDRTNRDVRFARNRIRHELLPRLAADYNPRVRDALVRLAEVQRVEDECLEEQAAAFLDRCAVARDTLDRSRFSEGHPALQRRALVALGWRWGVECPFDRVDGAVRFIAAGSAGRAFDLGGDVLLRNARDVTEIFASRDEDGGIEPIALAVPGESRVGGMLLRARLLEGLPESPLDAYCTARRQVFDAEALGAPLMVRTRQPGDRIAPLGMTGSRKLKDYFSDLGLPLRARDRQLLVVGESGIIWVVGRAVSTHAAVTQKTRRFLEMEVFDAAE